MEDRETKFQTDIAKLISSCEDCKYLKVKTFAEDTLQLELVNPFNELTNIELSFSFSIRDYPDGTVLSRTNKMKSGGCASPQAPTVTDCKTILCLAYHECYEFCKAHSLEIPSFVEHSIAAEKIKETPNYCTQVSVATSSGCAEADENSDLDDYINYDEFDYISEGPNKLLEQDIVRVHHTFGLNSLETREYPGIDEMDLLFNIDLNNLLDVHTASGWGVSLVKPLVIMIHITCSSKYLDGGEPLVEVFQESTKVPGEKRKAGVGLQMKKIIERYLSRKWKELSNAKLEENFSEDVKPSFSCHHVEQSVPVYNRQPSLGAQISLEHINCTEHKAESSLQDGFLVMLFKYALDRILTLNEYCVICDEKHVLESGLMKPCVCTRELCVFAFQTLGVMADAAETIAADANVIDLLIAVANTAACSSRCKIILDPYPSIVDPEDTTKLALDPNETNYNLVKTVMADIVRFRKDTVKGMPADEVERGHKLSFPLMQWIIVTCQAHIVLLPEDYRLKSMSTKYQFLLISSPPKKEASFKSAKKKFGSQFAFHGSAIENWHSILRKGLINATGSKYQLHGAAHGSGVYLSPRSNISFNYSNMGTVKATSAEKDDCLVSKVNLKCVALCEVVKSKDLKKSGDIWVMPNSDHVCTRFFFVYDNSISAVNVDTHSPFFRSEIDHAMTYIDNMRKR